ncbi:LysR substrate-binding domain-containing protein [Polaromonas sp. P1-6]|nr:LysR substrate-binding domain-containing protein [Polaromonas sp. P1-6]
MKSSEAADSDMHWRLSLSDLGEMLFLPELAGALRSQAPGARLSNISVAATEVAAALEAREIDLAIGILQPRHRGIRTELLFHEHYVAVAAPQWRPASGRSGRTLTPQQLAEAAFVVASPTATFHGSVEQMLVRMKLEDRIVLRARHFGALPDLALTTDLLSIVPEMYAHNLRQRYDFRVWGIPSVPAYEVRLVWHSSTDKDPAHQWMRAGAQAVQAAGAGGLGVRDGDRPQSFWRPCFAVSPPLKSGHARSPGPCVMARAAQAPPGRPKATAAPSGGQRRTRSDKRGGYVPSVCRRGLAKVAVQLRAHQRVELVV